MPRFLIFPFAHCDFFILSHACLAMHRVLHCIVCCLIGINEHPFCEEYKLHIDTDCEQWAKVGVLRELFNCRDGYNYDRVSIPL